MTLEEMELALARIDADDRRLEKEGERGNEPRPPRIRPDTNNGAMTSMCRSAAVTLLSDRNPPGRGIGGF
jgi:hypothetical protein